MLGSICGLAIGIASACSADPGENQDSCPADLARLSALAAALPGFPTALAPGLEGPALLATLARDRFLIDPDPTTRGEHAGLILSQADDCELELTAVLALPLAVSSSRAATIGTASLDGSRAALLVTGSDVASTADAALWDTTFAALDLHGQHLAAPSQATFEAAIRSTCAAIPEAGLLVLVLSGRGSPGNGGAFLLTSLAGPIATPEVISYRRVEAVLSQQCSRLAAIVWVVDASHFELELASTGAVDPLTLPPAGTPLVVVRASDRTAPDAARASRHGPGALSQLLSQSLPTARASLCHQGRLTNAELTALFADPTATEVPPIASPTASPAARLHADLLRHRWERFGVPAVARLDAAWALTPSASEQLRAFLAAAVPLVPILVRGTLPGGERCSDASDCAACEASACLRSACIGGLCRFRNDDGATCDDDNDCTRDDRCNDGDCHGALIACDDNNPCTDESCEPGRGCVAAGVAGRTCDDRDPCTSEDLCTAAGACVGSGLVCDDGDPCTVDRCTPATATNPGGCVFEAKNLPCDDGNPCTLADQCRNLVCSGTRKTCSDGNECTTDRCDQTTGECRFDVAADLASCDDGDPCTTIDRCRDGACRGLAATCDDGIACTFDSCEQGLCRHLPAPGLCLAPGGSECVAVGERPASNPCLVCVATDRLAPTREGESCTSDGSACTIDVCEAGVCTHRDGPDSCHDGVGRCVTRGEALTDCLVCQGSGIVTAAPSLTPCGDALGCAAGSCDGLGTCLCPVP